MDKLTTLPSLQPSSLSTCLDSKQRFSPNGIKVSQQFPNSLPPIIEGEHYGNSNENELNPLALRRFSLPSISSFDQPLPQSMGSPVGFRKMSLPTRCFPGYPTEGYANEMEMFACQYPGCFWSFKRSEHLKRHMTVHTRERPFLCTYPDCNRGFSRSDNLNVHYRTHFEPSSTCNRELKYEDVLKRQASSPTTSVPSLKKNKHHFVSQKLPKLKNTTFSSGDRLPSISQNDSCNKITLPSIDQIAGRFKHAIELESNVLYSRPEFTRDKVDLYSKPYNHLTPLEQLANVASFSFMVPVKPALESENFISRPSKDSDSKLIWNDIDDEGRPIKYYVCQFKGCNMKFKRSEHLTRHRLVHTMERPFSCTHPGCNKAFSRADNLRQHTRIHTRPHPSIVNQNNFNTIRVATNYQKNQNQIKSQKQNQLPNSHKVSRNP